MAQAKKLSEALSELSNDSSISGDERIVVSDTDGKARTIPAKSLITMFSIEEFGSYSTWSDCQTALDGMATESIKSGRYVVKVGGVPYYLTFVLGATGVYWQMIEGGIVVKSDGTLGTDTTHYCTFVSRYYENGAWSAWQESAKKSDIPKPQDGTDGYKEVYIYSHQSDKTRQALSAVFKVYQYNGRIRITHKQWGSTSDYSDGKYYSADMPTVNSGADGAADHYVHARILNHTLVEANSTTDAVKVNYTNFASSGNKTLTLTAATSAKAGVMTVDHVHRLDGAEVKIGDLRKASEETNTRVANIEKHYKYLGNFTTETDALNKLTELDVCANAELLHAHLTYTYAAYADSTIILVQSIHGAYCRQVIFNKDKIFQRCIYFKDENRTTISWKEDWNYLFCDRLSWNASERKYIPSQFGSQFNSEYTDQIPLASDSVDGLMSKEDKALLEKIKKQLNL